MHVLPKFKFDISHDYGQMAMNSAVYVRVNMDHVTYILQRKGCVLLF